MNELLKDTALGLLLPCPFCGARDFDIRERGRQWMGAKGWSEPVAVDVVHWCPAEPGQPSSSPIMRTGRELDGAVAAWNRRA